MNIPPPPVEVPPPEPDGAVAGPTQIPAITCRPSRTSRCAPGRGRP